MYSFQRNSIFYFFSGRSECRNQAVAEVVVDVFSDSIALVDLHEFLIGRVVLVLFAGSDDVDIGGGVVFGSQGFLGVQAGRVSVAGIDDGDGYIIQGTGKLSGFEFDDLEILRVGDDIAYNGLSGIGAVFQLDQALFFQEKEGTAAVGGVIRNGNLGSVRYVLDRGQAAGIDAERCEEGIADGNEVGSVLFIECIQEGSVLEGVQVDISLCQCLVGRYIVGKGFYIDLEALLFCFLGYKFHNLFGIARGYADGDFFLFCRSGFFFLISAAAGNSTDNGQCSQGYGNGFLKIHHTFLPFIQEYSLPDGGAGSKRIQVPERSRLYRKITKIPRPKGTKDRVTTQFHVCFCHTPL